MKRLLVAFLLLLACSNKSLKKNEMFVEEIAPVVVAETLLSIPQDEPERSIILDLESLKPDTIFFDFDSFELDKEDMDILDGVLNEYYAGNYRGIKLDGHTCPIGQYKYNSKLSYDRALAVKKYLASHDVKNILTNGYSEDYLICTYKKCYHKNRRCEVRLIK